MTLRLELATGDQTEVDVNASDGQVFDELPADAEPAFDVDRAEGPPPEGDAVNGTVGAAEPETEHAFQVEAAGHAWLSVGLAVDASSGATLNATVEGPEGQALELEQASSSGGSGGVSRSAPAPSAGTWTVTVTLEEGTLERYRVAWCASDEPTSPAVPNPPPQGADPCDEDEG